MTDNDDDRGAWENLRAPNPPGLLLGDPTGLHAFVDDHGGWYVGIGDSETGDIIDGWNEADSLGEAMKAAEAVYEAEYARRRPLTPEDVQAALDYLEALQGHFEEDEVSIERGLEFLARLGQERLDEDASRNDGLALHN